MSMNKGQMPETQFAYPLNHQDERPIKKTSPVPRGAKECFEGEGSGLEATINYASSRTSVWSVAISTGEQIASCLAMTGITSFHRM